jgi:long-chain acyl-CoA synthetase
VTSVADPRTVAAHLPEVRPTVWGSVPRVWEKIKAALKSAHPLIGQAVAIGDRRPYNTALIVLDPDVCAAFARDHGIEDSSPTVLAGDERVHAAVAAAVADANTRLSRVEQIKRHTVLPCDWGPGGDELTPTMKLRRKPIAEKYATEIDAMYADTRSR